MCQSHAFEKDPCLPLHLARLHGRAACVQARGELDRKRRECQGLREENEQLQQQLETKISMLQSVRAKFQAERRAANEAYTKAQHYLAEVNQHHANSSALCEELDEQLRCV